jgi:predicted unusual protein kinase regulating ubiquinone biosynthesis (AarF/ABC1/UbiB family)
MSISYTTRNFFVVASLAVAVAVTTNVHLAFSFQHPSGHRRYSSPSSSSALSSSIKDRVVVTSNDNSHSNVPYKEAQYDPHAADIFYESRPMKSINRFVQISTTSSRFIFNSIFLDKNNNDNNAHNNNSNSNSNSNSSSNEESSVMTNLERKRSRELVNLITELGPAFIKVGQALSTRTDLIPTDKKYYGIGLSELQDSVQPSFSSKEARQIIEDELNIGSVDEIFEYLSDEPVASASIGQVYKGKLRKDGMEVAVKVQRPNVLENVALDLYVMRSIIAPLWKKYNLRQQKQKQKKKNSLNNDDDMEDGSNGNVNINDKSNTDFVRLIDAWGSGFVNELDYRSEAKATKDFTKAMKERGLDSVVFAPEVMDELSSTHVLVTKWVDGERLSTSNEDDVPRLCGIALNTYLTMLLDTGALHCDPHPGNLLRTPEGKLCILDWGMVLDVPKDLQLSLLEFIADLKSENYEDVPMDLVKLKFVPEDKLDELRQSGLTVAISKMLTLAAEGGGPKGAMERMVAQNKEKYADALAEFDDIDGEEATKVRQRMFQEDWQREMAEDSMSRSDATTSTTVDVTTKIEQMRQQNTDVFSIPDYFVYMSRAFATLEGIGLSSNSNYSILKECYPYISKRLLTDDSPRARKALRMLIYGKDGTELDLSKLQDLSTGLESYTTSTSSIESGRGQNDEGRNAAIEQVANVVLSEDTNYVQELLMRETAVALDATIRDTFTSPFSPLVQNIPISSTPPPAILRPFTLPFELVKASFELQSVDDLDEQRLENVRILTKIGSDSVGQEGVRINNIPNENASNTIGRLAREAAKRRIALARVGVRFGGVLVSVQAERLRERASSGITQTNDDHHRPVTKLAERLATNRADRLEALADAITNFDNELAKRNT